MLARPVRLAVLLPPSDLSPSAVRSLVDLAMIADDLWVDEVVVTAGRGPDPLAILAACGRATATVGLVAGLDVSGPLDAGRAAVGAATVHALTRGRLALLLEECARAPDQAAALMAASRAGVSGHLAAYVSGSPAAEVLQLAATVADGWQFPPAATLGDVAATASAVGDRRHGMGRRRDLEVRTILTPRPGGGGDESEGLWDLSQVNAHAAAGASVVVADLGEATARGIDVRLARTAVAGAFADLHVDASGRAGERSG